MILYGLKDVEFELDRGLDLGKEFTLVEQW